MEVTRAKDNDSTTLDSTVTWIDTILCRLQETSFDYRGLNDLKPVLELLRKLLLRAKYLRSDQSSILYPFSEDLRRFYLLLISERKKSSERRFVHEFLKEIPKFIDLVKSFQQQFCERNTNMLDAVLDELQLLVPEYPRGDHDLSKLKLELKLIRTFYQCAINWRNQASHEFSLSKIKCDIYEMSMQFCCHLPTAKDSSGDHELAEAFSLLKCSRQPICEFYTIISNSLLLPNASPWLVCEIIEFFDSLLDTLGDIIIWGESCDPIIELIKPLQENLVFLKNFIHLVTFGGETPWRYEKFFFHCQVSAVNAASLGYMGWFKRDNDQVFNELRLKSSELVQKINPVNDQVSLNYRETLMTWRSRYSFLLTDVPDMHVVGDFADSLLGNLREFLDHGISFMVSLYHQMQIFGFGERLQFFTSILKQKFYGLHQDEKHVVIDVVCEAANIVFQLYTFRKEESLAKEMDVRICQLLEKIDSIEAKVGTKFPSVSTSNNPTKMMDLGILGSLRTFFLCARIYHSHLSLESSASLSSLEQAIPEAVQPFLHSYSLITKEGRLTISDFSREIYRIKGKIDGLYADFLECLSKSISSSPVGELLKFLECVAKNLVHIKSLHDPEYRWFLVQKKLIFLKNFIRFAVLRGVEQRQLENFLIHCQVVGIKSAHMSFMPSWFHNYQTFDEGISELVEKIKPVHPQVRETYIQVLKAVKLSGSSLIHTVEGNKNILGDLIDSLLGNLWEVLLIDGTSFMQSGRYQMQMLYEGLQFLRNILRKQQEKFNGLQAHSKDLVAAVITDAGILIFSINMHQMDEVSAEEMVPMLFSLLEKIESIKAEVPGTYPVKSTFNFPATNELEFIDLLLENLKELARYALFPVVRTVQEDLLFLRSYLPNIVEQRNQHEKLQAFWSHVMEVAYEAEFVIDSMMVGGISHSARKLFNTVAEEIKLVKTEAFEIDHNKCVLVAQKASKTLTRVPLRQTISTINEDVVGLNDEAKAIVEQLKRGSMQFGFVSIVGMPGLGKTTLAQRIYHNASIIHHFHILAWCCISQVYNRKDLLIEILACIFNKNYNKYSQMCEDDLAQELFQRLKGKRYLVVLDDVWDIKAWNALRISFPNDANGSRILLTSRLSDVALQINPNGKLHPLRRLTDAESLELLQKKLVGKEDYYPALPILGEKIARNCHGLPLTVVVIAGILATLDEVGWEDVSERLSHVVSGTEDCTNVLELSYWHLPDFLKPCLLYFGAFLEDEEISVARLMQLWIAEGFVEKNGQKSQEEMAEEYIMALISRSLIMVAQRSSIGGVKTCRVHDLLHEFCVAKAKEESFLQLVRGYDELSDFDASHNLRRICIYTQPEHFANKRLFCPRLRTLLFSGQSTENYDKLSDLEFVFCLKLLRVLDLEDINLGRTLPGEICMLVQLRYLAVRGWMTHIPCSIVNLFNLETFRVYLLWRAGTIFPDTIWTMQKLRNLRVNGFVDLTFAEGNLGSTMVLHNLDTFSAPKIYLGKMEKVLRKFPNIRKLKCCVVESRKFIWERKKIVEMGFLSRLQSLNLTLDTVHLDEIEIRFPSNLKKLTLQEFSSSFLSQIGKLRSLQVLKLINRRRDDVKIWEMEEEDFPELKVLKLAVDIERWKGSGDHLPCLQKLILIQCEELKELPSCLECISTLEKIEVRYCPNSVVSLVQEIEKEQVRYGNEDLRVLILKNDEGRLKYPVLE